MRAAARAFEMAMKIRVVNPFTYLGFLIFPLIMAALGLALLSPAGGTRTAYAVLGGGLVGFFGVAYVEGGNEIQNERWTGTLEQVMGCPTPLVVIVIGKLGSSLLVAALSFIPAFALAYFGFNQSLHHVDPIPFAIAFAVLTFTLFSTALALAPLYTMWRWAFSMTNGFEIGIYALCGFMFPITQLPAWLQVPSAVLSPTWATRALYASTVNPAGHDWLVWCAYAVGLSAIYLVLSWFLFRMVDVRARVSGQLAMA